MIESCVEAHIDDCFPVIVNIKQPCCCGSAAVWENDCSNVSIVDTTKANCHIEDHFICFATIQDTSTTSIMVEWVCGTGYAEHYLHVTPTETQWITVEYDIEYYVRSNTDWIVQ